MIVLYEYQDCFYGYGQTLADPCISHLSSDALILLCFQKVEQHLQQRRVLPVRLHNITGTGDLLAQSPQRHLVGDIMTGVTEVKAADRIKALRAKIHCKQYFAYFFLPYFLKAYTTHNFSNY